MDLTAIGMDPYLIPGTDVLQNKLGITDGEQLKEMDKKLVWNVFTNFVQMLWDAFKRKV